MSLPAIRVSMGFRTGALGAIVMTDVTTYVQTINTNRGRSRQLQEFNAGTASLTLWNKSRAFDPLNTASPFWNTYSNITGITPRTPISITANGIAIFTGLITDWNIDYDLANNDMANISCVDNFTVLSNITLNGHSTVEQTSSARIAAVLAYTEVAYVGSRSISTGSSVLGGTAANSGYSISFGTNLLNYLQTVTTSEQGFLYMSAGGVLTFKGRTSVLNQPAGATFSGSDIKFNALTNEYGDELLFNYITTQGVLGTTSIRNLASIALYQTQTYSATGLLNSTIEAIRGLGEYLLGKFKLPVLRFNGLGTQLVALTAAQQDVCLGLDLTSVCTVVKNYSTGTPTSSSQQVIVSGISHNITPGSHNITYTFESADLNQYLTLNSPTFGRLDYNLLAF